MLLLEEESIPLCWLLERDDELEAGRGGGGVLAAPDSRVSSTSWDAGPSIVASSSMTCPQDGQADSPPVSAVEQAGQRGTRHCTRAWASLWPAPLGFGLIWNDLCQIQNHSSALGLPPSAAQDTGHVLTGPARGPGAPQAPPEGRAALEAVLGP